MKSNFLSNIFFLYSVIFTTVEVLAEQLTNGSYSVLLVNRAQNNSIVNITWKEIGFSQKSASLKDLRDEIDLGIFNYSYYVYLKPGESQLIKVTPLPDPEASYSTFIIIGAAISVLLLFIAFFVYYTSRKREDTSNSTLSRLVDNSKSGENEE